MLPLVMPRVPSGCSFVRCSKENQTRETRIFIWFSVKTGVKTWCFGGQFVARCVVDMVFRMVCFESGKAGHAFEVYFASIMILIFGPGLFSLDALIARRRKTRDSE
jgi:hypothetical protein